MTVDNGKNFLQLYLLSLPAFLNLFELILFIQSV